MAFDATGGERQRLLVTGLRRRQIALPPQCRGQVVECGRRVRPQRQRLAITGDRFVEPAEILQRHTEVVVQFRRIGAKAQRPLETADRPLGLAELVAGVAEVVERVDRIGRERERAFVTFLRLGRVERFEDVPEIMVKSRDPAVARDRRADAHDRGLGTAAADARASPSRCSVCA